MVWPKFSCVKFGNDRMGSDLEWKYKQEELEENVLLLHQMRIHSTQTFKFLGEQTSKHKMRYHTTKESTVTHKTLEMVSKQFRPAFAASSMVDLLVL